MRPRRVGGQTLEQEALDSLMALIDRVIDADAFVDKNMARFRHQVCMAGTTLYAHLHF